MRNGRAARVSAGSLDRADGGSGVEHGEQNSHPTLSPPAIRDLLRRISRRSATRKRRWPCVASSGSRYFLRQMVEPTVRNLFFISHNEATHGNQNRIAGSDSITMPIRDKPSKLFVKSYFADVRSGRHGAARLELGPDALLLNIARGARRKPAIWANTRWSSGSPGARLRAAGPARAGPRPIRVRRRCGSEVEELHDIRELPGAAWLQPPARRSRPPERRWWSALVDRRRDAGAGPRDRRRGGGSACAAAASVQSIAAPRPADGTEARACATRRPEMDEPFCGVPGNRPHHGAGRPARMRARPPTLVKLAVTPGLAAARRCA